MISSVSDHEKEWVRGLSESREDIFRTVYDAYQRHLFAFAYYLTKSRNIAEEVVQEVFTILWEKRALLKPDTYLLSYLKKMAQNKVIDIFRKAAVDKRLADKLYDSMTVQGDAEIYFTDLTLEKELSAIYRNALDRLPPQQRLVFLLRRDENLSYKEIAYRLGLSLNTVRNHLAIATRSLHRDISRQADISLFIALGFLIK